MANIKYSINPYSVFNTFTSLQRNSYLTSSVGITLATFSRNFKGEKQKVKFLSIIIMFYSSFYGIKNAYNFSNYLDLFINNKDKLDDFTLQQIESWKIWVIYSYIYVGLSLILVFFLTFK